MAHDAGRAFFAEEVWGAVVSERAPWSARGPGSGPVSPFAGVPGNGPPTRTERVRAGLGGWGEPRGGRTGSKELDETGPEEEASREGVHGAHEDECAARGGVVRCARGKEEREADGLSDRCGEAVGERHEDGLDRARDPHAAHGRRVGELEQRDPCPESEALECLWRRLVCGSSVTERQVAGGRWRAAGGGSRTSHVAQIRCRQVQASAATARFAPPR